METQHTKNKKAFPDPLRGGESSIINQAPHEEDSGMDLRDYFAAKAMQALITHFGREYDVKNNFHVDQAYIIADDMMKAREKATGQS